MRVRRALARVLALLLLDGLLSSAATAAPASLSVAVATPPSGLLVQEMARLTVRAVFDAQPNLVTLTDPAPTDARLLRLGPDHWSREQHGGPMQVVLERSIGYLPQQSGALVIPPFRLQATLLVDGEHVPMTLASLPARLDVRPAPVTPGTWWLPARSVALSERWTRDPATLRQGDVTQRTIIVEASGITPAQLPPLRPTEAPGLSALAEPVEREVVSLAGGPNVRGTYRWELRLDAPAATLAPLLVPWFDTGARRLRSAELPGRRFGIEMMVRRPAGSSPLPVGGAAVMLLIMPAAWFGWRRLGPGRPARLARQALRQAATRADPAATRNALANLRRLHDSDRTALDAALQRLDRHLYADAPGPMPDLRAMMRSVLAARPRRDEVSPSTALVALDGPPSPAPTRAAGEARPEALPLDPAKA